MAGGGGLGEDGLIQDINVTPLVDIMLCLMVIFIIASAMVVAAPKAIEVDLPKAASGAHTNQPKTFAVAFDKDGRYFFNGAELAFEALRAKVRAERAKSDKVQAIISADGSLAYSRVMRLIDAIRVDGVERYALNIEHDPSVNPAVSPPQP